MCRTNVFLVTDCLCSYLNRVELGHYIRDATQITSTNKKGVMGALAGLVEKLETKFGAGSLYGKRKVLGASTRQVLFLIRLTFSVC